MRLCYFQKSTPPKDDSSKIPSLFMTRYTSGQAAGGGPRIDRLVGPQFAHTLPPAADNRQAGRSHECFLSAIRDDVIQLDSTPLTSGLEAEGLMPGRERIATRKECAH